MYFRIIVGFLGNSDFMYDNLLSKIIYECVMSHMNEQWHTWMGHCICEWVMSHMTDLKVIVGFLGNCATIYDN